MLFFLIDVLKHSSFPRKHVFFPLYFSTPEHAPVLHSKMLYNSSSERDLVNDSAYCIIIGALTQQHTIYTEQKKCNSLGKCIGHRFEQGQTFVSVQKHLARFSLKKCLSTNFVVRRLSMLDFGIYRGFHFNQNKTSPSEG